MRALALILSGLPFLLSVLFLIRLRIPQGFLAIIPKMAAGALSPYWAIMGVAGAIMGWAYRALWAIPLGIVAAGLMSWYLWRCTRDHHGFEDAFGAGWSDLIPPEQAKRMVRRRWTWFLSMKASPEPSWERDISFCTIPGTDRELLCDVWSPADGKVSGLGIVYFHGGAWYLFDKDFYTRALFHHLVAQGHTVMDVAYRLCPEVDMYGIIGDVKRAIAWMKANASRYGVNPEKIALLGNSVGGHLALMAAYAPDHPELTPEDIENADLSVCGVVSYYGPTDLLAAYEHENQQQFAGQPSVPIGKKLDSKELQRIIGRFDIVLGGHPQDARDTYRLFSPVTHVNPGCPPTLLIQGDKDLLVPVDATCALYAKLVGAGVPAINIVFPWTDHGFDMLFPQVSPPAQSVLYDVDRFLALLLYRPS